MKTNEDELARRAYMLEGGVLGVTARISAPLVLYSFIANIFGIFDMILASYLSPSAASTVAFIAQIQAAMQSLCESLAVGGGVLIARYYGAMDLNALKRCTSTLFAFSLGVCAVMAAAALAFQPRFLRLLRMPADLSALSLWYFRFDVLLLMFLVFNALYFATEKAKGNTRRVLACNLVMLVTKCALSVIFIIVLRGGVAQLGLASFCAHGLVSVIAAVSLFRRSTPFTPSPRHIDMARCLPGVIRISLPIFIEKFLFNFGKVIVNSMAASYGSEIVGALGISNRVSGTVISAPMGVQDSEASIVSVNAGAGNKKRVIDIFKASMIITTVMGAVFFVLTGFFKDPLIGLFAGSSGEAGGRFAAAVETIYNYERYALPLMASACGVLGFLYGTGRTRMSMLLNVARLAAFRIPLLAIFLYGGLFTDGAAACGLASFISNAAGSVITIIAGIALVRPRGKAW